MEGRAKRGLAFRESPRGRWSVKVLNWSFALLVVLTGVLGLLHDTWPAEFLTAGVHFHLLFGVLLASWVVSCFYWRVRLSASLPVSDIRKLSRHLSRWIYLLLYALFGIKQIMALVSNQPLLVSATQLQVYLGSGLLALILVRVLAAFGPYLGGQVLFWREDYFLHDNMIARVSRGHDTSTLAYTPGRAGAQQYLRGRL
jgi:hypothetical protein